MEQVTESEVTVVDQLGRDALAVHVGQPEHGVVQAVPPGLVRDLELRQHRRGAALRAEQEDGSWIDLVVLVQTRNEVTELRVEVLGPELLRNSGVRVG